MTASRDTQTQRYVAGMCISCGLVPYSAGRPRCEGCHRDHVVPFEPGMKPRYKVVVA